MMSSFDDFLPAELSARVDGELAKGERVIWTGQPIAWRFVWPSLFIVLFGIPWTAFAIFWMAIAGGISGHVPEQAPDFFSLFRFFPLFGIPFVLIGLAMLSAPYWALRKARRTVYAITDRRVLLIEGGLLGSVRVRSIEPERLNDVTRTQYADGSGNLILQRQYQGNAQNRGAQFLNIGFYAIPDVKHVEDLVRELASKAAPADDGR
jgi:hypothetical protein